MTVLNPRPSCALQLDGTPEHVRLWSGTERVAEVTVALPETTDFGDRVGIDAHRLAQAVELRDLAWNPSAGDEGGLATVLYAALRHRRIEGRTHYVAAGADAPLVQRLRATPIRGGHGAVHGVVDEALLRCFDAMSDAQRDLVRGPGFVEEIRAAVMQGVQAFVSNPFFEAARAGTLSQAQYVHSLANNHLFARYTTRILGHAVGMCEDLALRAHYANHLSGEVNHEVWLEQDLAYLDGDVDYVRHRMVPDVPILMFCAIQESQVSFRQDPVVFLGVPAAIEGASAFLPMETIDGIRRCIRSWGYDQPKLGSRFLASHVGTDGGHGRPEEGHYGGTMRMLAKFVTTEHQQQQILRVVRLVFQALTEAYAGFLAQPAL